VENMSMKSRASSTYETDPEYNGLMVVVELAMIETTSFGAIWESMVMVAVSAMIMWAAAKTNNKNRTGFIIF